MGISVPSTMNNIFEEIVEETDTQGLSSFEAIGKNDSSSDSSNNVDPLVVTAIVEDTSKTRPHQSGSIC